MQKCFVNSLPEKDQYWSLNHKNHLPLKNPTAGRLPPDKYPMVGRLVSSERQNVGSRIHPVEVLTLPLLLTAGGSPSS